MDQTSIDVAATPEAVYDLVAEVTNMGRWSPENYRTEWVEGASGPQVGAKFKGWNQDKLGPIPVKWATVCTVKTAARGEEFAFTVRNSGATWSYSFEPSTVGTKVTETREDGVKPLPARIFNVVVPRRDEKLVAGMQETLKRIKEAAEQG